MSNIKKIIKKILPDKLIYDYRIIQILPQYIRSKHKAAKISIPEFKMMSDEETVDCIINKNMSLSRFGDGEFLWMCGQKLNSFQKYSPELEKRLINTMKSKNEKLLIGFPKGIIDSHKCNLFARMYWTIIRANYFYDIAKFLDESQTYCDASITRPYIDYCDIEFSRHKFENLKRIWDNKNIVIVEGKKIKLGIGNDLFDNALSIKRIICPAENAFESLEKIEESIKKNVSKDTLMLAALGPTATILASDMCDNGYQMVDIGHIDVEYMWYLHRAILREPIEGKSVNESGNRDCSNVYDNDKIYLNSIICEID